MLYCAAHFLCLCFWRNREDRKRKAMGIVPMLWRPKILRLEDAPSFRVLVACLAPVPLTVLPQQYRLGTGKTENGEEKKWKEKLGVFLHSLTIKRLPFLFLRPERGLHLGLSFCTQSVLLSFGLSSSIMLNRHPFLVSHLRGKAFSLVPLRLICH